MKKISQILGQLLSEVKLFKDLKLGVEEEDIDKCLSDLKTLLLKDAPEDRNWDLSWLGGDKTEIAEVQGKERGFNEANALWRKHIESKFKEERDEG